VILTDWITSASAVLGGAAGILIIATIARVYYDRKVLSELKQININIDRIKWLQAGKKK